MLSMGSPYDNVVGSNGLSGIEALLQGVEISVTRLDPWDSAQLTKIDWVGTKGEGTGNKGDTIAGLDDKGRWFELSSEEFESDMGTASRKWILNFEIQKKPNTFYTPVNWAERPFSTKGQFLKFSCEEYREPKLLNNKVYKLHCIILYTEINNI